jgi:hypothetical protein
MRTARLVIALISACMLSAVGCGQNDSLSGKVTYNGEPVESGSVSFSSVDGSGPGFGAPVTNGQYKTDKIRLGEHRAFVRGVSEPPPMTRDQAQQGNRYAVPVDYIPEDAKGNNETFDIKGGAQTIDFDLTGPPRPN